MNCIQFNNLANNINWFNKHLKKIDKLSNFALICKHFANDIIHGKKPNLQKAKNDLLNKKIQLNRSPILTLNKGIYQKIEQQATSLERIPTLDEFFQAILSDPRRKEGELTTTERFAYHTFILRQQYPKADEKWIQEQALSNTYDQISLISNYVEKRVSELKGTEPYKTQLVYLNAQINAKNNFEKTNQNVRETNETNALIIQRQILLAKIQEQAVKEAYRYALPQKIKEGFYNPSIVFDEIKSLLKVSDSIPQKPNNLEDVKNTIREELVAFQEQGRITKHQKQYIESFIYPIVDQYQHLYKKSLKDTLIFTRNLARAVVYQEYYDKSSFSGSDHGAKHVHNNIEGSKGLHKHMKRGIDYTSKDEFIEQIIHIYHDIGYTVGLATKNFSCSKDHPLVGAKIIEENKDYFTKYLDNDSYKMLHKGILYHAIMYPNLSPKEKNGFNPDLIRGATSISDACAVFYDRKTQEFWEEPKAVLALAKLKMFMTLFPKYASILADNEIMINEWNKLDPNDPMDRIAHDLFQRIKQELNQIVDDKSTISPEKKQLYKQAIQQQFNAFKANVTLGQYAGALINIDAVRNQNSEFENVPKFLPKFAIAPSYLYEIIRDLFGEEQATRAFGSLCKEFGFDIKNLTPYLNEMATQQTNSKPIIVDGGVAQYEIHPEAPSDSNKHRKKIERGVYQVAEALESFVKNANQRKRCKQAFDDFCISGSLDSLGIITEYLESNSTFSEPQKMELFNQIKVFQKENISGFENMTKEQKEDYGNIVNALTYLGLSNSELTFLGISKNELELALNQNPDLAIV